MHTLLEAEQTLTGEERLHIQKQGRAEMEAHPTDTESSRGEGPSELKGKETDPRKWGQLDLNRAELDTSAQRTALEQWNKLKPADDQQGSKNIPLYVNSDSELAEKDKLTKEKKC